jgi:DNA-binding transcriptional LysR family regulator
VFDLGQLRCFVVLAEELHFSRAARRLNMTQPPLSRQIQVLERILDVTLLERTSRSVRLTPAGRAFLPEARRLVRMANEAALLAKRVEAGKAGALKLVFTAASTYAFLPQLIAACATQLDEIDLTLTEMVTRDQIDALLSGSADVGLMRPPVTREELQYLTVGKEALIAVVPQAHPLANSTSLSVEDFHGRDFIMYATHDARYFHDLVVSLFSPSKVQPHYVQHMTQIHSMLALVRAELGCAIVPESAMNLHYEGVRYIPLKLKKPSVVELDLVWRRDADPIVSRLIEVAKSLNH